MGWSRVLMSLEWVGHASIPKIRTGIPLLLIKYITVSTEANRPLRPNMELKEW